MRNYDCSFCRRVPAQTIFHSCIEIAKMDSGEKPAVEVSDKTATCIMPTSTMIFHPTMENRVHQCILQQQNLRALETEETKTGLSYRL